MVTFRSILIVIICSSISIVAHAQESLFPYCKNNLTKEIVGLTSFQSDLSTEINGLNTTFVDLKDQVLIPQKSYFSLVNECAKFFNTSEKHLSLIAGPHPTVPPIINKAISEFRVSVFKNPFDFPLYLDDGKNFLLSELVQYKTKLLRNQKFESYRDINKLFKFSDRIDFSLNYLEQQKEEVNKEHTESSNSIADAREDYEKEKFLFIGCSYYDNYLREKTFILKESLLSPIKVAGILDKDLHQFVVSEDTFAALYSQCRNKVTKLNGVLNGIYSTENTLGFFARKFPVTHYSLLANTVIQDSIPKVFWQKHKSKIVIGALTTAAIIAGTVFYFNSQNNGNANTTTGGNDNLLVPPVQSPISNLVESDELNIAESGEQDNFSDDNNSMSDDFPNRLSEDQIALFVRAFENRNHEDGSKRAKKSHEKMEQEKFLKAIEEYSAKLVTPQTRINLDTLDKKSAIERRYQQEKDLSSNHERTANLHTDHEIKKQTVPAALGSIIQKTPQKTVILGSFGVKDASLLQQHTHAVASPSSTSDFDENDDLDDLELPVLPQETISTSDFGKPAADLLKPSLENTYENLFPLTGIRLPLAQTRALATSPKEFKSRYGMEQEDFSKTYTLANVGVRKELGAFRFGSPGMPTTSVNCLKQSSRRLGTMVSKAPARIKVAAAGIEIASSLGLNMFYGNAYSTFDTKKLKGQKKDS